MYSNEFNEESFREKYRIKSTRLPHWDYGSDGYYFVTICVKNMIEYFGDVKNGIMGLNELGCVAAKFWQEIPKHFDNVRLDEWVVMPNHVHILLTPNNGYSLSEIIHSIKSYTAKEANSILSRRGEFWQADYFDRFIRNKKHFDSAKQYIEYNPVLAGLCDTPHEWEFSSAREREE